MKKSLKVLALVMGAILLVCGSVAATLAWLTSQTDEVENTFTVGNVTITLDEAVANTAGVVADATIRTTEGNEYHLIPSQTYEKDPTVHVAAGSENCYLFVEVQNDIADIEAGTTIAQQMATNGWTNLSGNVWYYGENDTMDVATVGDYVVFEEFTIAGTATDARLKEVVDTSDVITIKAYAVQAAGIDADDIAVAWAAAQVD